jgi:hypothetical protein
MKHHSPLALFGRLVMALLAVFAFGAIAASVAQAEEAPHWQVEGKVLKANETRLITIKAYEGTAKPITLESEIKTIKAKVKITCLLATAAKGAFLAGGEPGTGELTSEFLDCKQEGNGVSPCKLVKETIKVEPVRFEIVVNPELTKYLIEFDQSKTENFVKLEFTGGGCAVKEAPVKGLVVGLVWTDPKVDSGVEEEAYTSTPELASLLVRFPDPAEKVWLWKGGVHEEHTITPLKFIEEPATLEGTVLVLLANSSGESTGEKYNIRG